MEKLIVQAPSGSYNINFGPTIWEQVTQFAKAYDRILVVSDTNVAPLYGDRLPFPISAIKPGESQKNLSTVHSLVDDWLERGLGRYSLVIALGGGVIGDVVGLAASVYQRGIAYLQIPTTLLAQVDSGVGGKTGVNTAQGKNLIGTFYQPWGVFIDPAVLKTLPPREMTNGLGEVLKYGIIADPILFDVVQRQIESFFDLDLKVVGSVVRRCCELKSEIVGADEEERGIRKILNHGHTFGHALEVATGYELYNHGEAVLIGMLLEARLAKILGLLSQSDFAQIKGGLNQVKLNYDLSGVVKEQISTALLHDKKNRQGKISFILPQEVGRVTEVLLSPDEVASYWEAVFEG